MADYKDSLNLPETAFPMKASLAQREPERLHHWQQTKLFEQIQKMNRGKKRFILHDGPPYANGHLHCGHALNKILKDIIVKSKSMSGYDAPYVPGWDCHGLPIELNVEKKYGKAGSKLTMTEFRKHCRDYAASQIDIQREEFQRLGVFGDWHHPYATDQFSYEANIIRALGQIIRNGHLQQGFKPVHWCIECGSALAEAEVEYEDKASDSIDVAFFAADPQKFLASFGSKLPVKPVVVPIWTTTPWSLPANEAVCLHPELEYHLVDTGKSYYLIAAELTAAVMKRYEMSSFTISATAKGRDFLHTQLQHPFFSKNVPVIVGEHVTIDSGTGAVHTAPVHGPDDYQVGQLFSLPLMNPLKGNGCFIADLPVVGGLFITQASKRIIEVLKESGHLLHHASLTHSYPHCWRHKTPMLFLATPQWFISMDKNGLRQQILEKINEVNWLPSWGKTRIAGMIENRPDWCISRQRAWGTPMPLFIHKETRQLHPDTLNLLEEVASRVAEKGIDAWFDLQVDELLGDDADDYEKLADTLDVWFDSGVSHYCVLKQREALGLPADMYLEGSDQHRGWFNSSITTAVAMYGDAPYRTVLTHGYTVDAEGRKLSKSKGNYIALDKLISLHGADILRLWVASTDYRNEVSISEEIIKRTADAYRRIRNTARFLLANLFDFDPELHSIPSQEMVELDRWALKSCQILQDEIIKAYENYNFHSIYQKIHNFCAVDMGSFYLDVIKDRQYTMPKNSTARRSCQTAMYHIIQALTRWLAPILSFTADEIWEYIPGTKGSSVFLQHWYQQWPEIGKIDLLLWEHLQKIRNEVNKALEQERQAGVLGSGLAASVDLFVKDDLLAQLQPVAEELRFLFIVSELHLHSLKEKPVDIEENSELQIAVKVDLSAYEKCVRCWHRRESVGTIIEHPELCERCIANISGYDEQRKFA